MTSLDDMRRELRRRYDTLRNPREDTYVGIEAISSFLTIPERDKKLYRTVYIGETHPRYGRRPGLWYAVSLPGAELWLRWYPRHDKRDQDKATILHEHGHYVWYFDTTDEQKRVFRRAYSEAEKWAESEAEKWRAERVFYPYSSWKEYFTAQRAGRNVKEAYAEAYAWHYTNPVLHEALKENRPEIYRAFIRIENERVR